MTRKSEGKHTAAHIASYHAEDGVRAAATLVHFGFSIMTVFCMNKVLITSELQRRAIKNESVSDAITLLSPLAIQDRACSGDVTSSSVRSATYTFFCGPSGWELLKLHSQRKSNERRTTYVVAFTDFQRLSFPAFTEQICDRLVVDLHVAHAQEKLLLRTLERCREIKALNAHGHESQHSLLFRTNSIIREGKRLVSTCSHGGGSQKLWICQHLHF